MPQNLIDALDRIAAYRGLRPASDILAKQPPILVRRPWWARD